MSTMWPLFVVLLLASGAQGVAGAEKLVGFATLPEEDEVEVKLLSLRIGGSQFAHEFRFRSSTNASVSVVKLNGPNVTGLSVTSRPQFFANLTNRVPLGSLALTKADLLGLDLLMEFYRQKRPRCVTDYEDFIVVTQRHNGQVVAAEEFHDATGGVYTEKIQGVRELFWFYDRLERQLEKSKR